jgi:beta-glucosidase-like glycosyl hydrolase
MLAPWILGFRGQTLPQGLRTALRQGHLSGLILFKDNLGGSVTAARALRKEVLAEIPPGLPFLFVTDEEGGLISQTAGLCLEAGGSSARTWKGVPTPRALGRIGSAAATRWVGHLLGRRLRVLGITVDLAPSLDLDTETRNPIIGSRSFSDDAEKVTLLGGAFARGLFDAGVGACFKHYPGHGGTMRDSHLLLPRMDPRERAGHELPFRRCLGAGPAEKLNRGRRSATSGGSGAQPFAPWVMSAHVDWGDGVPASLSPKVLGRLRRRSPRTILITDALEMKAVSLGRGGAERALLAGNDCLLVGRDWEAGLAAMAETERKAGWPWTPGNESSPRSAGRMGSHIERGEDRMLRAALRRASRRLLPSWTEWDLQRHPLARLGEEDERALACLHRLAVRLSCDPGTLPSGPWVWVLPEGLAPYVLLRGWKPTGWTGERSLRICWVPEDADPERTAALAQTLAKEKRPILIATLFRGRPTDALREAWKPLFRLAGLRLVAHLLDEGWPARGPCPVALTSGPSRESLTGLGEALQLPSHRWGKGADGWYFPVDRLPAFRVK